MQILLEMLRKDLIHPTRKLRDTHREKQKRIWLIKDQLSKKKRKIL